MVRWILSIWHARESIYILRRGAEVHENANEDGSTLEYSESRYQYHHEEYCKVIFNYWHGILVTVMVGVRSYLS